MEKELLDLTRSRTKFKDIETFTFDTTEDSDIKFFCKIYYTVLDSDVRADILADFTAGNDALLTDAIGMLNYNWLYELELYLLELWKEDIIEYLSDEHSIYINDDSNKAECA